MRERRRHERAGEAERGDRAARRERVQRGGDGLQTRSAGCREAQLGQLRCGDDVDVEVHVPRRGRKRRLRERGDVVESLHVRRVEQFALERIEIARSHEGARAFGHNAKTDRVRQVRAGAADEHREGHPAEIAAARRARRVEVPVRVEPDHARREAAPLQPGYRRERRGAVAARDHGGLAARGDPRRDLVVQPRDHRPGRTLRDDHRVVGGERVGQLRQRLGVVVRNQDAAHGRRSSAAEARNRRTMPRPLIELERVNVHLDGRRVLHDVSWALRSGQQWAIVGPNGSGKTTLLGVIRGDRWIDRDGGLRRYALDGIDQPVSAAAPHIGYISPELQERYTRLDLAFSGRVLVATGLHDAVYLPRGLDAAAAERVDAVLDRFGLDAIAARPVRELSFGQLRVLLVARALVRAPRVLVLDEFTNGLDRRTRRELLAFLERVAGTTHVVCASHRAGDLPETTNAHAVLSAGRIAAQGDGPPRSGRRPSAEPARSAASPADDELVAIRGADVYRGDTLVLRGIDWSLRRGEHTLIRGENGSGKSTFAELVAGTVQAAHGADVVRFGERGPFDLWELKRRIVHVSDALQTAYDMNPTAEDVVCSGYASSIGIMLGPDAAKRADAVALMHRLGLDELRARAFLGLSFGERRKVLIARGLVNRPEVLILDEIWSGLDEQFREMLRALLTELVVAGTTVIVISHHDDDLPAFVRRECVVAANRITTAASRGAP